MSRLTTSATFRKGGLAMKKSRFIGVLITTCFLVTIYAFTPTEAVAQQTDPGGLSRGAVEVDSALTGYQAENGHAQSGFPGT